MIRITTLITAALAATLTIRAAAGPLTPPPGPVSSTPEIEPRRAISGPTTIVFPGTYYLTQDIIATGSGITIGTGDVTIDLNGFTIRGDNSGVSDHGINISSVQDRPITIKNGNIRDFAGFGVNSTSVNPVLHFENIRVTDCQLGFELEGAATLIDCSAKSCAIGFRVGTTEGDRVHSTLTRCRAENNTDDGFFIQYGILRDCSASNNADDGIYVFGGSLTDCAAYGNGARGIFAVACNGTRLTAVANNEGLYLTGGAFSECSSNSSDTVGIRAVFGAIVRNCRVDGAATGIIANSDTRVEGCSVTRASNIGIFCQNDSFVVGNVVEDSSTPTPYDLRPGSVYGQIIDRTGGGALTTSVPAHANFIY